MIETMSAAFVAACDALHLKIGADPAARFVAEKVIALAQRGIRDSEAMKARAEQHSDMVPQKKATKLLVA
jgi:hypothetical protein